MELTETLEQITDGLENFKAEQRRKLDQIETRMARPGQAHTSPTSTEPATKYVNTTTGEGMLTIRSGDNVQRKMADKGMAQTAPDDSFADFLRGVAGMKVKSELSKKALSAGTDANGGFLLPTEVMSNVLQAMVPQSTCMQAGASTVMLDGPDGAKSYSFAAISTIPTAAWRNEAGNVTESDPVFRSVVVIPRSLAFFFKVSRELLADAANLNDAVLMAVGQSFAKELDRTGLLGTGTAPEPRGLLNTVGIQAVTNGAAGASLASTRYANLFSAAQAILTADGPMPTAAIMSHRSRVGLASLADTTNQPLQVPGMLSSMQLLSTSQISNALTVGGSTDCSQMFVGDFSHMGFALRENFSVQAIDGAFATTGQIGFFCHARADVFVNYPAAFALVTGVRP